MRSGAVIRAAGFDARSQRRAALGISLLLNLTFLLSLRIGSAPHRGDTSARVPHALLVRLIDAPSRSAMEDEPPLPVTPQPPAAHAPSRATPRRTIAVPPTPIDAPTTSEVPSTPKLFDSNGRVALPPTSTPRAGFVEPPRNTDALTRREALPYAPTRFDRSWTPDDETLGGEILRKSIVSHTWRTPWGGQVRCSTSLLLGGLLGGCGWGHAPSATAEELRAMRTDPPPSPATDLSPAP